MKTIIISVMALFAIQQASAQSSFSFYLKDSKTKESVPGATANIQGTTNGGTTDIDGLITLQGIANGQQIIIYKAIGYKPKSDTLIFPLATIDTNTIFMDGTEAELDEVTVSTTRSTRTIKDIPTRVEVIGGEELDEKGNMKPGDIRMMLSESTGIQTLQTSATSGNSSIRIEGLDGRYTQILKDGFPLYAGFSGGLGLLQTPPLDLKQVEIIKGSSSTLYGGGAIAGLINLISKTPKEKRELRFLVNGTSALGLDINGYYGQRFGKVGLTIFAAYNSNAPYDPAGIGLTAIPKFERYTFNPKLFFYLDKKTDLIFGLNTTVEKRLGGDIQYIKGNGDSTHSYYEDNNTQRYSSQLEVKHRFSDHASLSIKNSIDLFDRVINTPGYKFDGSQTSSFTEASYLHHKDKTEWVGGANVFTDGFSERKLTSIPLRNYTQTTIGGFIQNTWDISHKIILESGLRSDYILDYGWTLLPRISLLYKINSQLTSRLGGGLGYKTPTIFTEESERIQYHNVLPISADSNKLEKSYGANWDVNYRTSFADGSISFSVNQLFFYTRLNNPLLLTPIGTDLYQFKNVAAHIDAQGAETNIKLGYKNFKLYLGYTCTYSYIHDGSNVNETPLTPRHHTNSVLTYEIENKLKLGLEAYYYSPQKLSDGSTGRDYWLCGFMAERAWKKFSLFINFENFLDTRQTRFGAIYTGSLTNPIFKDIYAPLDGFVANGGIKINL
ncbi:MAG: TonB-dependent receptor plug domain-containing protein [Flavipsychrobacter sp.]|nr:TonB-dependent receptor plug domain-containing protein [Flavipsychrobacter sp.]